MIRSCISIIFCTLLIAACEGGRVDKAGTVGTRSDSLRRNIESYLKTKRATVGVAVLGLESGDTLTVGNARHYPMQSVYKFHLALAILHQVDSGKLSLTQNIRITKNDVHTDTWSPVLEDFPEGNVELTLSELLNAAISQSDNNACDVLFRIAGGTEAVNAYVHSIGITDVAIAATEVQMHTDTNSQYTNWTTPMAAVQLLGKFFNGSVVSKSSREFLWSAMVNSENAPDRIKGRLPKGTIVAHKTGSSFRSAEGVKAALNDIGIITLPNGTHIALAIFVTESREDDTVNADIIATIAKMVWDVYAVNS